MADAKLPTYKTAAQVLERDKGSGWRLAGWTVMRTLLIAPPMLIAGADAETAWTGAAIASGLISVFTLLRIFDARTTGLGGLQVAQRRPRSSISASRRRARSRR